MTDSSKRDSSKCEIDEECETEVQNLRLIFNPPNSERNKSSGLSSDDEATSSSLLPLPDTLRQMRGELKRIIDDAEESAEVDSSSYSICGPPEMDVPNSLEELRRKYSLKNEASVAMKMNSANLMLDDILNSGKNNKLIQNEAFQSKCFREQNFKLKKIQELDSLSLDSASTVKHEIPAPISTRFHPSNSYDLNRCHCQRREKPIQPVVACPNFSEKGLQVLDKNHNEEKQKKMSFLEKLHNLHLKYRIQSVYKIVQKKNPFNKDSRQDPTVRQGIPNGSYLENSEAEEFCRRGHCEENRFPANRYPKRMIFDLVESSDSSRSDGKSTQRECTCHSPKDCTCPELISRCNCIQPNCDLSKIITSEARISPPKDDPPSNQTFSKVNEFVQTESVNASKSLDKNDLNKDGRIGSESDLKASNPASSPEPNVAPDPTHNSIPKKEINERLKREPQPEFHDWKSHCFKERKLIERTDIYYFDHGNSGYYRTTDNHPVRYTECLVERTDEYATKFWGEIFGVVEIGVAFLISFILQLYRFFFTSIIRSLTVGFLQIFSDYFFKPLLTITFNGIIQPCLILAYNIATSLRDLCFPISQIFGFFTKEVANLFRSCRLVEVNHNHCRLPACHCGNKV